VTARTAALAAPSAISSSSSLSTSATGRASCHTLTERHCQTSGFHLAVLLSVFSSGVFA